MDWRVFFGVKRMSEPANPPLQFATDLLDYTRSVETIRAQLAEIQNQYYDRLPMWVVFGPTTPEYPGIFLCRPWLTLPEAVLLDILVRAHSLDEMRELLPDGLANLGRQDGDNEHIIEVWI
jgi:hypothetical protein